MKALKNYAIATAIALTSSLSFGVLIMPSVSVHGANTETALDRNIQGVAGVAESIGSVGAQSPRGPQAPAAYSNVLIVSPLGGDFTSVQAALNSITANSATNKYLVWIGPGTYTEQVTMKPYVDIEGAGEKETKITYVGSPIPDSTGSVVGASNAELRSLTVENTGGNASSIAIYNNGASPSLLHVTAIAFGTGDSSTSAAGMESYSSSAKMDDVTVLVSGGSGYNGVLNFIGSSTVMNNVTISVSGAPDNRGIYNVKGSSSIMSNVFTAASGGSDNVGLDNQISSPTVNNVTATASGGSRSNVGLKIGSSSPSPMTSIIATAIGARGSTNYGLSITSNSALNINGLTATASGGLYSYGAYSTCATVNVGNSSIKGHTAGLYSQSSTTLVHNSQVSGTNNTLFTDIGSTVKVGGSYMNGGPVSGGGTNICAASYDENYVFYTNTCL